MGFITCFTGGVTLTLGITYLTLLAHRQNRQAQALSLRSQSYYLETLISKSPTPALQTHAELAREERSTVVEAAKDRWNSEVENAVKWVQRKDWGEVREGVEGTVARLLGRGLRGSREGVEVVERRAGEVGREAVDRGKGAASRGFEEVERRSSPVMEEVVDRGKEVARRGAEKVGAGVDMARESTKSAVDKAVNATKGS